MFYKVHLLQRMGKCNGGANEREIERESIEIAHHETKAFTLYASVCKHVGVENFFFLSSFPFAMCSFFLLPSLLFFRLNRTVYVRARRRPRL